MDLTYANLALMLLGIVCAFVGRCGDIRPFFYLAVIMGVDLLFRAYQGRMSDVGYSVNIGKMALFALVAQQIAASGARGRGILAVSFGLAAIASEVFALQYPSYREELYSSQGLLTGLDDAEGLLSLLYRPTGLIGDPNYFAIPLVLMGSALFTRRRYGWFCFMAILVAITGSRAALVALFLPIAVQKLFDARTRPMRLTGYVIGWSGIYLLVVWFNSLLRGDTADSNTERTMLLHQGLENVLSLSFLHTTYGQPLGLGIGGDALVVHNTYLQTAVTSALLAIYLVCRSVVGMIRSPDRMVLGALIIEMLFLDVSSFSSILFAFFIFSEGPQRRTHAPPAAQQTPRLDTLQLGDQPADGVRVTAAAPGA